MKLSLESRDDLQFVMQQIAKAAKEHSATTNINLDKHLKEIEDMVSANCQFNYSDVDQSTMEPLRDDLVQQAFDLQQTLHQRMLHVTRLRNQAIRELAETELPQWKPFTHLQLKEAAVTGPGQSSDNSKDCPPIDAETRENYDRLQVQASQLMEIFPPLLSKFDRFVDYCEDEVDKAMAKYPPVCYDDFQQMLGHQLQKSFDRSALPHLLH